jgi:hypothetical protein
MKPSEVILGYVNGCITNEIGEQRHLTVKEAEFLRYFIAQLQPDDLDFSDVGIKEISESIA